MKFLRNIILLALACCFSAASGQEARPLVLTKTIVLSEVQNGFNHMSADASDERLFVAAPAGGAVMVVDLRSGKLVRSLAGGGPAAARFAPEFDQLYVSNGEHLDTYNASTLALATSLDLGTRLDELQYDARAKELYVGCMGKGKAGVAIITIPEGKLIARIFLRARPQGIAVEHNGKRIFANVPSLHEVAVVDRARRAPLRAWPVHGARGNTPIALDEAGHRLFLGARQPPRLLVLDTATGRQVAGIPIDEFADDMSWDSKRRRIYISCDGFTDVIAQQDVDHYLRIGRIPTAPDSATSTFSPELDSLFVGVPPSDNGPARILVFKPSGQ